MNQLNHRIGKELLVFICASILFAIVLSIYINKNETLKSKNDYLQTRNEQLELENNYLNSDSITNMERNSFTSWRDLNQTATELVKSSKGNFKKSWALYLVKEARLFDINPFIVFELLRVETGNTFDPKLVGPETKYGKAYGMAQFMKNTAPWIANMAEIPYNEELLFDPYYSIHLTFQYLDFLNEQYNSWEKTLTAYHRGMNGLETYMKKNGHADSWYAVKILSNARDYNSLTRAE